MGIRKHYGPSPGSLLFLWNRWSIEKFHHVRARIGGTRHLLRGGHQAAAAALAELAAGASVGLREVAGGAGGGAAAGGWWSSRRARWQPSGIMVDAEGVVDAVFVPDGPGKTCSLRALRPRRKSSAFPPT